MILDDDTERHSVNTAVVAFTVFFANKKRGGIEPPLVASIHQNY
jgi:hypothetical protein